MKILTGLALIASFAFGAGQPFAQTMDSGKVVVERFLAPSLQGNLGGEDPQREVLVYLPPGYAQGKTRYPVVYSLHGFTVGARYDMDTYKLNELLDDAIRKGRIRPMIFVLPDSYTKFGGSFYSNSAVHGRWADYIAKDVVALVDGKYRTMADRESRGICGHSMGGNGAIRLGMLYSEVFGAVYALSPSRLDWGAGITVNSPSYKAVQEAKTEQEVLANEDFHVLEIVAEARVWSPNKQKPPFYIDLPFEHRNGKPAVEPAVYEQWDRQFPINMIAGHSAALKKLRALKLDWGRNDEYPFIPVACLAFSKKLEAFGIAHFAEEFIGTHDSETGGYGGRMYTEVFPFFDAYLRFEGGGPDG